MACPTIFVIKQGEVRRLVVLDDDAAMIGRMHRRKVDDRYVVIPCRNQPWRSEPCPLCASDESKLRALLTVIDVDGFVGRDGNHVRFQRRLYMADDRAIGNQPSSMEFLSAARKRYGTLRGFSFTAKLNVAAHGSPGDEFVEAEKHVRLTPETAAIVANKWGLRGVQDLAPFEYAKFVREMTVAEMQGFIAERLPAHPQRDAGIPAGA